MYKDILKENIISKIRKILDIPVIDNILHEDNKNDKQFSFPKLLIKKIISETEIEVIDFKSYDEMGLDIIPSLKNIVGLYLCIDEELFLITDYIDGTIILEKEIPNTIVEYVDVCEIVANKTCEKNEVNDYMYVSSISNFGRRLNYKLTETYRRFEIGIFCYNDPNESKCNYYMEKLRDEFSSDFKLVESNELAYIFNPIKFDIVENGRLNRVIYGSIMIKTYK